MSTKELKKIPYMGVGIGLRSEALEETYAHANDIDVVEIISEQFFRRAGKDTEIHIDEPLKRAQKAFNVVPHGVDLSIGSAPPLERKMLDEMKRLCDIINAPYYSDHFALTRLDDLLDTGHLTPLWFTKEMLEHLSTRIEEIQRYLGRPLVLENITAPFTIGEADYEEPEFITEVCRKTGCGLLLDVTNVFINAYNAKENAQKNIERYPMDHVVHIHLAGGEMDEHGYLHDSHSEPIHEEVWPLLSYVAKHADIKTLIIERDEHFDQPFDDLILKDLRHARSIVEGARSAR